MERDKLAEEIKKASDVIQQESIDYLALKSLDSAPLCINKPGTRNLVIVMEELAELQQEISKYLRGKGDRLSLTEEVADVYLALRYVELICDIDKNDIHKIMNIKMNRVSEKVGMYT